MDPQRATCTAVTTVPADTDTDTVRAASNRVRPRGLPPYVSYGRSIDKTALKLHLLRKRLRPRIPMYVSFFFYLLLGSDLRWVWLSSIVEYTGLIHCTITLRGTDGRGRVHTAAATRV